MSEEKAPFAFWREYPERDTEYVRYYPPSVGPVGGREVWGKKEMGLYVQIPFCRTVCKYCPFNKYPWDDGLVKRYLKALKQEMRMVGSLPYTRQREVTVLNFGGGTPSALETGDLLDLLDECSKRFDVAADAEISVEANPETVDEEKLRSLLDWGVNRVSFGVQSFEDSSLRVIGRSHRARQSVEAIETARRLGLENIGIDLLYRVPGQTMDQWQWELDRAVELGIHHISIFSLLLNPGTRLFQERKQGKIPEQPPQEVELEMYRLAMRSLKDRGYSHYIVYDFALPGSECDYHNLCWHFPQREYPGLGAGANSFINGYLYTNANRLEDYMGAVEAGYFPIAFGRKLTKQDEISRALVLGTKFFEVKKQPFEDYFGVSIDQWCAPVLRRLEEWGLLENRPDAIRVTEKGKVYMSNVNKAFYAPEHKGKPQPIAVKLQKGEGEFLRMLQNEIVRQ
jgi:oxygen-independent coproporphyrinogen-3 oxidase